MNNIMPPAPPEVPRHKLAFALGGGIARGFAHIGALEVLAEEGVEPDIICGTSIGALAGAAYSLGKLDVLKDWALSLNRRKVFSYLDFKVRSAGLIGGYKMEALMREHFGQTRIEEMRHRFLTVATDLATGHEVWIGEGDIVPALQASFALPGVFAPVERDGRFLVDGALVNPVPVSPCHAMGGVMTVAVDLNADIIGKARKPGTAYATVAGFDALKQGELPEAERARITGSGLAKRLFRRQEDSPSLFGVMVSALGILQDRLTRSRLAGDPPDIHIRPAIGHIGLMEFERAEELIRRGREAALRAMPDILEAREVFFGGGGR